MPQPYVRYFWNVCRSRTPLVEKAKILPKPFNGSIASASKLSVIRIQSVNSMSHIELDILIGFGKTGVSMTHVIQIRELIRIRLCHGNRANSPVSMAGLDLESESGLHVVVSMTDRWLIRIR